MKADLGWAGLAAYVLGYDTWALATGHDTLSAVFHRSLSHSQLRWPVVAACAVTVLHLFDRLPRKVDPFHHYTSLLVRIRQPDGSVVLLDTDAGAYQILPGST